MVNLNSILMTTFLVIIILAIIIYHTNRNNTSMEPPPPQQTVWSSLDTPNVEEYIITIPNGYIGVTFDLIGGGGSGGNGNEDFSGGGGGGGAYRQDIIGSMTSGESVRITKSRLNGDQKNGWTLTLYHTDLTGHDIFSFECPGGLKGGNAGISFGVGGTGGTSIDISSSGGNGFSGVVNDIPGDPNGGEGGSAGNRNGNGNGGGAANGNDGRGATSITILQSQDINYGGGGGGGGKSNNIPQDQLGKVGGDYYWRVELIPA